jgi:thymidylate synthase
MDINIVWKKLISDLINQVGTYSPRGAATKEILGYQTQIDMNNCVLDVPKRNIGKSFRYAEAAWILSGDNRVKTIAPYSKMISQFSDDGVRFFGSYGPKIVDQISYVIDTLHQDKNSRQAVINIWREKPPKSKDIPCTCSLQFLVRDNKMQCIATMRSSDAWLGWPYDVFNFTCVSIYTLLQLKHLYNELYTLGTLTVNAGSQHIYERDWEKAKVCIHSSIGNGPRQFKLDLFEDGDDFIEHLWGFVNG